MSAGATLPRPTGRRAAARANDDLTWCMEAIAAKLGPAGMPPEDARRVLIGVAVGIAARMSGREFAVHPGLLGVPRFWPLPRTTPRSGVAPEFVERMQGLVATGGGTAALGPLYESSLRSASHDAGSRTAGVVNDRKRAGAYYTPAPVVEHLLDRTLALAIDESLRRDGRSEVLKLRLCDPACGSGNFLVAAVRRIARSIMRPGRDMRRALQRAAACVAGMDIDPLAVDLCRAVLALETGTDPDQWKTQIRCADALTADWSRCFPSAFKARAGFDVVVGNPPFLSQLAASTAVDRDRAALLKARYNGAVGAYTDPAALFLVLSTRLAHQGGRVSLVLPESVLSARDAAGARRISLERARLESLWIADEPVFDAGTRVCAPTLRIGTGRTGIVQVFRGLSSRRIGRSRLDGETWSAPAAVARGVPPVRLPPCGTLADIATATADFRDQYYGLRGCIVEDGGRRTSFPPLITTGLIDPARCRWGTAPTVFDRQRWRAPRVDLSRLEPSMSAWARSRLVPKVLLATQTRVLEAFVDERGDHLPAVPIVTIVPRDKAMLWHIAAVLLSPVASAWAVQQFGGAGLSGSAMRLSARQTLLVPLPSDRGPWDEAAEMIRAAQDARDDDRYHDRLAAAAQPMCRAYGVPPGVFTWWQSRLPRCRRVGSGPAGS